MLECEYEKMQVETVYGSLMPRVAQARLEAQSQTPARRNLPIPEPDSLIRPLYARGSCVGVAKMRVLATQMGLVNIAVMALASAAARRCCPALVRYVGSPPCICFLIML